MALLNQGWSGKELTIVEPSGKTEDDRTWSYWAKASLLPSTVPQADFSKIVLASDGNRKCYDLDVYRYYSVRSSHFYAYAKGVLAKADVRWISDKALSVVEGAERVEVFLDNKESMIGDYVLDSRPSTVEVPSTRFNATLQHFGGWFVEMPTAVFDPEEVVFMDFISIDEGVAFFYVIPSGPTTALVEIAVFSEDVWSHEDYDKQIADYIHHNYGNSPVVVSEREYGVIPMTDQPLWKTSGKRVWNIGTRGGWVQPSSGYAFTRTARFADEVAHSLKGPSPKPWTPSPTQQVFNSVMLGYIKDNPEKAGSIFYNLFAQNGPTRTFDFLDEASSFGQTIKLMWSSPQIPFAMRAVKETLARLTGVK